MSTQPSTLPLAPAAPVPVTVALALAFKSRAMLALASKSRYTDAVTKVNAVRPRSISGMRCAVIFPLEARFGRTESVSAAQTDKYARTVSELERPYRC